MRSAAPPIFRVAGLRTIISKVDCVAAESCNTSALLTHVISVVIEDVPPHSFVGGIPAKEIRKLAHSKGHNPGKHD